MNFPFIFLDLKISHPNQVLFSILIKNKISNRHLSENSFIHFLQFTKSLFNNELFVTLVLQINNNKWRFKY